MYEHAAQSTPTLDTKVFYFSTQTPISPICRTPLFPHISEFNSFFDTKGIESVRRDGCPAVVKVLDKSLRLLFSTNDLSVVKAYLLRQEDTKAQISHYDLDRFPLFVIPQMVSPMCDPVIYTPHPAPTHPTLRPVREATLRPRSRLRSHLRLGGETRDLCV